MPKQPKRQRKLYLAGKEFIAEEIRREEFEELEKLEYEQTERENLLYVDGDKHYRIRITREYLQAEELTEQIRKEQKELGIDDWLDKNKPGLAKERRQILGGNASTIYYNFSINQELFTHRVITRKQVKDIVFDYLKTEDQKTAWGKLIEAEEELKNLLKPSLPREKPRIYPITTELEKKIRPIWLTSITSKDLIKEEEIGKDLLRIYKGDELTREVYFNILRGQLETLKDSKSLTLGGLGWGVFMATVGFASKQGTLSPVFTKTDKLKCLGYTEKELKRGGRIYELIEKAEKLLAYLSYELIDKRKGKAHREIIGHLYERLEIRGEGKGAIYNPTLSEETIGKDLHRLIKQPDIKGISYKQYPQKLLEDRELSTEQKMLCAYLVGLQGFKAVDKTARYLLLDIMGMSGKQFKARPQECYNMLVKKGLEIAKNKGYLKDYKPNYKGEPQDVRKWHFTLYLPKRSKQAKKEVVSLTQGSDDLIGRITEWNSREVFNTRKPREEIRIQVINTINKYGQEAIREIFEREVSKNSPHPKNFWNEIKKLKRRANTKKG